MSESRRRKIRIVFGPALAFVLAVACRPSGDRSESEAALAKASPAGFPLEEATIAGSKR